MSTDANRNLVIKKELVDALADVGHLHFVDETFAGNRTITCRGCGYTTPVSSVPVHSTDCSVKGYIHAVNLLRQRVQN
jgi:hypothetical protein